jgi:hypothetical protein
LTGILLFTRRFANEPISLSDQMDVHFAVIDVHAPAVVLHCFEISSAAFSAIMITGELAQPVYCQPS